MERGYRGGLKVAPSLSFRDLVEGKSACEWNQFWACKL